MLVPIRSSRICERVDAYDHAVEKRIVRVGPALAKRAPRRIWGCNPRVKPPFGKIANRQRRPFPIGIRLLAEHRLADDIENAVGPFRTIQFGRNVPRWLMTGSGMWQIWRLRPCR